MTTANEAAPPTKRPFGQLETLSLHGEGVTTAFASAALEASPILASAHLYQSAVDDGILAAAEQHPRLEYLSVVDTSVNAEAIEQLLQKRPAMRVYPLPTLKERDGKKSS